MGVFIAPYFVFDWSVLLIALTAISLLLLIFVRSNKVLVFALASLFLLLGFLRFNLAVPGTGESQIANYAGEEVGVSGFVSSYPQGKERMQTFYLSVNEIYSGDNIKSVEGKIFVITSKINEYSYGQKLLLEGLIEKMENTDEFNFKDFFISRGVTAKVIVPEIEETEEILGNPIMRFLFTVRKLFENKVKEIFVEPFASLILGLLLGVKAISNELMEVFNKVSLPHIIVVSGYNLSIIANFLKGMLRPYSRRMAFWLPLLGVILFVFFVGADPPVVRAAIMASTVLLAKQKGRKANSIFALLFTAFFYGCLKPIYTSIRSWFSVILYFYSRNIAFFF